MSKKILVTIASVCLSISSYAAQIKNVDHMQTLTVDLSIKDPNIISVKNDRISQYSVVKGAVSASIDSDSGILSIKPSAMFYERPFSMIVFTEKGYRYTLISNPKSVPAQDIVLENNQIIDRDHSLKFTSNYETGISNLIRAMIKNNNLEGYKTQSVNIDTTDAKTKMVTKYVGKSISGEVLLFKNDTDDLLKLREEMFYNQHVMAINVNNTELRAGELTKIYRVVKNG